METIPEVVEEIEENSISKVEVSKRKSPLDDYSKPLCSNCNTEDSIYWTKVKEKLTCKSCTKARSRPKIEEKKADEKEPKSSSRISEDQPKDAIENEQPQGIKRRKGRVKQTPLQGKSTATKGKGRRSMFKKCTYKSPASVIMPVTSDTIFYKGFLYQAGDIVSVTDVDGKIYYAQIRGFLQDQYCEKSAALTWLIPTQQSPRDIFDPTTYILGPEEDISRRLACLSFVCNCPSDYFKIKNSPFTPARPQERNIAFTWTRSGPSLIRHA